MQSSAIRVLLIEDNPGDARLLEEFLLDIPTMRFHLEQAELLSEGLQRLQTEPFDVVLLDLYLPDCQELDTFITLRDRAKAVPVIVITGLNDETLAVRAVQEGAQDYLVKGQLSSELLSRSIRYAIERKRTEQKLQEQAALLDITSDAILVQSLESRILFWNKGAERLYGWKAEEAIGKNAGSFLYRHPSQEFEIAEMTLLEQGEWQGDLHHITASGQTVTVESRWTLIRDAHQVPTSILVVNTDVTEKKKLEAQFLRTQRIESLGTLAGGIAHDLNNILTPILATAQLLQLKFPDTDEHCQQLLQLVETNTKRGAALVKQVLSFARGAEGRRTTLQLNHLIREVQEIVRETFPKSVELYTSIPADLWLVAGNATQLHQVLLNLCVNARDAMPSGGLLSIMGENVEIDEEYARLNLDAKVGPHIVITVADTGVGIPYEIVDRIFEPFFTTKEVGKGTGLGLSTVLGIIKSHGGFIEVSSQIGNGTEFKVFLPAIPVANHPEEPENLEIMAGKDELILVVDDEAGIREISEATLLAYDYRVMTARDGLEAISLYTQHQDEISLVLIDIMMPSMDGAAAIRTLQQINPDIKIIAMSGLVSSSKLSAIADSKIQGFLSKPYTARDLIQTIDGVLRTEEMATSIADLDRNS